MTAESPLTIFLNSDDNRTLGCKIFPIILPLTRAYEPGQLLHIQLGKQAPVQAKIVSIYQYQSLSNLSSGFLQLVSGSPDAETIRKQYIQHYQKHIDLDSTPFAVFILAKL